MSEETTVNVKGLEQLLKALKTKPPLARVGIIGAKAGARNSKEGTPSTNAEVGAVHEFGTSSIPQRSFLRTPISQRLQKEIENSGLLGKDEMTEVIKQGSVLPWIKEIAVLAEGIVAEAFATGGFGAWPAWKTKGYTNNTGQLLIDTTQLRNSVTSEVKS